MRISDWSSDVCSSDLEWLSLIVKTRSSQAVKRLLDLQPETAHVLRNGREVEIVVSEVAEGDLVRIRPGERLAVDGEVVEGRSAVDQSLVTGEPMPVDRQAGDKVIGGTINRSEEHTSELQSLMRI